MQPAPRHEGRSRADRSRRFASAARHSARVRVLRWLVPAMALAVTGVVVAVMVASRLLLPGVDIELASRAIVDGRLVIGDPRLEGFTPDERAFRVSAQSASQAIGGDTLSLRRIRADMELEDGSTAFLTAESGTFDPDTNRLTLDADAVLETTAGLRAQFSRAEIDVGAGSFVTRQPVRVSQPGTQIVADSLSVEDAGKRLVFENNVSVVIEPSAITARAETE